jgi:hypothetical protein
MNTAVLYSEGTYINKTPPKKGVYKKPFLFTTFESFVLGPESVE